MSIVFALLLCSLLISLFTAVKTSSVTTRIETIEGAMSRMIDSVSTNQQTIKYMFDLQNHIIEVLKEHDGVLRIIGHVPTEN
jgi:hypothetical protein